MKFALDLPLMLQPAPPHRSPWREEAPSAEATAYVEGIENRVILIDGDELGRLMFEFNVGVSPVGTPYQVKKVDLDFFEGV